MRQTIPADVDVIIPVHDPDRPLARAIESVLSGIESIRVRILVVCHGIEPEHLRDYPEFQRNDAVVFLSCPRTLASPAEPRNHGLSQATAEWVALLDSDDWVETGAVEQWVTLAHRHRADAVIPRHVRSDGAMVRTPVLRPRSAAKERVLDAVADRLPYRVGHLGLVRRQTVEDLSLRYNEEALVGEDIQFSYRLWFSGARVLYGHELARYVVSAEQEGHITAIRRSASEELGAVSSYLASPDFLRLSQAQHRCVAVKFLRGPIAAFLLRDPHGALSRADRDYVRDLTDLILDYVPGALADLSVRDRLVIDRLTVPRAATLPGMKVLPCRLRGWVSPQGPFRLAAASALMR